MMKQGIDPSNALSADAFKNVDIEFTADPADISRATFYIVATPTPIDASCTPDISLLLEAMHTIGKALKKSDIVVIESTVYPGCTEEDCLPILEAESGLKVDKDFGLGYSPERINPGDKTHTLETVKKIVSARTPDALRTIANIYGTVVKAGIYEAQTIKVAEAAKIIENTQRDVNIALMNELSIIFARMGIETADVIEAARTKWNFMPFRPGLVGGHCIGVDPYYLDYKARELGYHTQIINRGRYVNDSMGRYVAKQTIKMLIGNDVTIKEARILVMGLTYKENVSDVRNTRTVDIIDELRSFSVGKIDVVDPVASERDSLKLYGHAAQKEAEGVYDAIIVAVAHEEFRNLGQEFFNEHLQRKGVLVDIHGLYRKSVKDFCTFRL